MKFYQTTWFIILMLVCFAPLGIFLMWKYKSNWSKAVKWILSGACGFYFLLYCIAFFALIWRYTTDFGQTVRFRYALTNHDKPDNRSDYGSYNRADDPAGNDRPPDNRNDQKIHAKYF